jgi:uracil-DNA glycosylase family 4
MGWTERQRAMLQEMGLRLWAPAGVHDEAGTDAGADAIGITAEVAHATGGVAVLPDFEATGDDGATRGVVAADATPSPGSVVTLGWPELRAAVAGCTACRLCEGRRQTVFGVGHERAHWMIVGEAPGEQEDLKGEPFVGAAGLLLDAMLHALNLTRESAPAERQVYIANTLKCRPPRNRNPEADEMQRCEPYLQRQIALVQPRVILAMGRFAVQSLLRSDEAVGRLRGRVHAYEGVPLVVTYHPAYLLRQPADKARAWDDLCLAAEVVQQQPGD